MVEEGDYAYQSWGVRIPPKTLNFIALIMLIIACPLASIAYELDRRKKRKEEQHDISIQERKREQ
jgi:hypothetical protein